MLLILWSLCNLISTEVGPKDFQSDSPWLLTSNSMAAAWLAKAEKANVRTLERANMFKKRKERLIERGRGRLKRNGFPG